MDITFPKSSRLQNKKQCPLSRYSELYAYGNERKKLMYGEFQTPRHKVFFVKDRVDKKDICIQYCPTEQMLADFFTKPLQG